MKVKETKYFVCSSLKVFLKMREWKECKDKKWVQENDNSKTSYDTSTTRRNRMSHYSMGI